MQDLNYDMDELYRQAGEHYPLKVDGANWSKVQSALSNKEAEPPLKENAPWHRLLYLLFFIPFVLICNQVYHPGISKSFQVSLQTTGTEQTNNASNPLINNVQEQDYQGVPVTGNVSGGFSVPKALPLVQNLNNANANLLVHTPDDILSTDQQLSSLTTPSKEELISKAKEDSEKPLSPLQTTEETSAKQETQVDLPTPGIAKTKNQKQGTQKTKRFYAGPLFGPDVTTVKFQKITDAGLDFGLLLGYQVTPKLSIEASVISSRKKYYADGEYFDKYSSYLPYNIRVTSGEGTCRMIEIPLTARYTFNPSARNAWFVAAGTSSYFMKKEDYDYYYLNTNTGEKWSRNRVYENSSQDYFAVAELSGGVSRSLGKYTDLRIQPYIKIPLKNVGYNELPLTSAGVHFVFTRKLF
ncbi:MAG TPA: hypothetical protein VGD26_02185 [Chitinophagaceae bacterium]